MTYIRVAAVIHPGVCVCVFHTESRESFDLQATIVIRICGSRATGSSWHHVFCSLFVCALHCECAAPPAWAFEASLFCPNLNPSTAQHPFPPQHFCGNLVPGSSPSHHTPANPMQLPRPPNHCGALGAMQQPWTTPAPTTRCCHSWSRHRWVWLAQVDLDIQKTWFRTARNWTCTLRSREIISRNFFGDVFFGKSEYF